MLVSVLHGRGWGYFDTGGRNPRDLIHLNEDLFGFRGREEIAKGIHGQSERIDVVILDGDDDSKGEGDIYDGCRCR